MPSTHSFSSDGFGTFSSVDRPSGQNYLSFPKEQNYLSLPDGQNPKRNKQ